MATAPRSPRKTLGVDSASSVVEQLVNRILKPLGLVVLSRDRIQETLEEAVERGRITRSDANDLVLELVSRGRQQTDELLSEADRLLGLGRQQLDAASRAAKRTVRGELSLPIEGYDELTAARVQRQLAGLSASDLRTLRDYERRHANRKSVLAAIDRTLD
jgi:polyhydroxyalkanoate synthesis regulator phasin